MRNFQSILDNIGSVLKKVFAVVVPVAEVAEPFVDIAFPGIAALYNSTVSIVAAAEQAAVAAGAVKAGPQKLSIVVNTLEPIAIQYFKSIGIKADQTVITNWVNAVVASLNAIPAPVAAPAPAPAK